MTTNVPSASFTSRGFVAPQELDILAGVQADQNEAFGGNLNPALNTPQGQLAQSETAIIGDANNQFLALANGVDPAFASGRMQDAIGRIYYLTRIAAASTVVTATCTGAQDTVIPVGAQAKNNDGNIYICTTGGTIPLAGTIDLAFACQTTGPVACPIASLVTIYRSIGGWDTITNAAAGVVGRDVESRADFEFRRAQSVALNGQGSAPSVMGAVLQVPGVLDAYVTENTLGTPTVIGGYTLAAHSLYISAVGGVELDVATAIWSKKAPGCSYNTAAGEGTATAVTVTDNSVYYVPPYPTYTVTFIRPAEAAVKFAVSMQDNTGVPADATTQIEDAIIAAFNGTDGGQRARIGSTIFASRFYSTIAQLGSWAQIYSVLLGTSTATLTSVTMQIDEVPTLQRSDITVSYI